MKEKISTIIMGAGVGLVFGIVACYPYPVIYREVFTWMAFHVQLKYNFSLDSHRQYSPEYLAGSGVERGNDTAHYSSGLSNEFRSKATFIVAGVSLTLIGLMLLLAWLSRKRKMEIFTRILRASIIYVTSMTALMLAGMWLDLKTVIRSAPDQDLGGYLRVGFIFYSIFIAAFSKPGLEKPEVSESSSEKSYAQFAGILASTIVAGFFGNFIYLLISGFTLLPLTRKKDAYRPARNLLRINTGLSLGIGALILAVLTLTCIITYCRIKIIAIPEFFFDMRVLIHEYLHLLLK